MWNPSEKEAKKAFDYASKSPDNYNKLNEIGKRAFWQYGKSKGIFSLNTLGDKAKGEYSQYTTDDIPYASDNPIERATLARQTEQGQFDVSEQVNANKSKDIRLLKERRLEEFEPTTSKPSLKNKTMIPVGKAGIVKTQARDFNGIDAALLGALDTTTFGALNIKDDAAIKEHKGAFTAGQVAGYIAPGAALTNTAGKGLAKLGAGKLLQNLGGSAIAGAAIDTGQGLVAGDTGKELAKRVGRGAIIGLAADGALMGLGKLGQGIMKKLADKQTLSAAEKAAVDKLPNEAKKEIILYVDTYGNVRKTPTTDLQLEAPKQNLPKVDEFKTITKTVTPEIEVNVPKVTIKKERYIPSASDIIDNKKKPMARSYKTPGLGGEPLGEGQWKNTYLEGTQNNGSVYSTTGTGMDGAKNLEGIRREREALEGQYKRVKNLSDIEYMDLAQRGYLTETDYYKYVEPRESLYPHQKQTIFKNIIESKLEGRGKRNSEVTFKEWYYRTRREEFDELKYYYGTDYRKNLLMDKGKGEDAAIKAIKKSERQDYKDFIEKAKKEETIMYPKAKFNNTLLDSTQTQKITQPPTLKGQTLKPNKPILSTLNARLNKPQIAPTKNIDAPFRLTPAEKARIAPIANQKLSGDINSLPLKEKPLAGQIKASDIKLGKATWKNKDYDTPIEIIGDYGTINGKKYVKIKGSDTGVPLDEVRYVDEVAAAKEVSPAASKIGKEIETEMEGATHTSNNFIKEIAPTIRDAKFGGSFSMTDIYRNFKHAFGKNYEAVKKSVLDPFDAAKKRYIDEQKVYTDDLYNNVVKKLGINKNTKESSAVQWFGEGKKMSGVEETIDPQTGQKIKKAVEVPYTLDDLKKDFPDKWQNIVEADKWFRKSYDELIDKVNVTVKQIYPSNPDKLVPKRADYYRHYREMANGFEGLKNVFDTPSNIDPKLVGISEFTQPKTKWASFKQKRGLGEYKADAVGGFLDYIKAASYSIHIDPQINVFRSMAKDIAETTEQSKNANNFIKFLRGYADDLSGKTNSIDRPLLDATNRQFMNFITTGNSRIKKNTVLMSAKSALSQLANIPLGVAKVKNPIHISKGVGETLAGFVGKGKAPDAYKQSQFITERYADKLYRRFDTKILDQPEKFASWMLESTDELGTKMIFNSVHSQAIAKGVKDPIKYADDVTRSLVAGRGIGEVPLAQKAKVFQIAAPFQLEVANQWHVMKDFINEKDFAAIPILLLGNYLFNNAVQSVTGSRVTFDPINAMEEALSEDNTNLFQKGYNLLAKGEKPTLNKDITPLQLGGRLGGEALSNIPLGSTLASQLPEAIRMKYFGRTDPTRFGTGLMLTKGIQDPLYKLLPPMGGGQIKKSIEGLKSMQILPKDLQGNKQEVSGSYNKGKLRFPVEKTPANIAKAALFGQYSSKEAVEYFRRNGKELSEEQTKQLENWVKSGRDPKLFYDNILKNRELNKLKSELSKVNKNDKLTLAEKQKERVRITDEIKKLGK
jgi:hypothetical protein